MRRHCFWGYIKWGKRKIKGLMGEELQEEKNGDVEKREDLSYRVHTHTKYLGIFSNKNT